MNTIKLDALLQLKEHLDAAFQLMMGSETPTNVRTHVARASGVANALVTLATTNTKVEVTE